MSSKERKEQTCDYGAATEFDSCVPQSAIAVFFRARPMAEGFDTLQLDLESRGSEIAQLKLGTVGLKPRT